MKSLLYLAYACAFPLPLSASVLKNTASTYGSASTGIPRSARPSSSGRWSNTSHVPASTIASSNQTSAQPNFTEIDAGCPKGGCSVPLFFKASDFIHILPVRVRGNDSLAKELKEECVLWDESCSGDKTAAAKRLFKDQNGTAAFLLSTKSTCFLDEAPDCDPSVLSEYEKIKHWMRSPQCESVSSGLGLPQITETVGPSFTRTPRGGCCGGHVSFSAGNVDVFFWPEPEANTSCLNIIGNSVLPLDYGATTGRDLKTYWGCVTPKWGNNPDDFGPRTYTNGVSFWGRTRPPHDFGPDTVTTAVITAANSVTFKSYLFNPWSSQPCPDVTTSPSITGTAPVASLHARAHPLSIPAHIIKRNGSRASTMVSGKYTFTSPSVYAAFTNLWANDKCGGTTVATTVLTFSPGELSTIAGVVSSSSNGEEHLSTRRFNFQDLPCPPQSIMEENWWKPKPGEPYRPFLAIPDQVKNLNEVFKRADMRLVSGFDPPKTLEPASRMAPPLTSQDPVPSAVPALTDHAQDPAVHSTPANKQPMLAPASIPKADSPQETSAPSPAQPNQQPDQVSNRPSQAPPPNDPAVSPVSVAQPAYSPLNPKTDPSQHSGNGVDPGQGTNPSEGTGRKESDSGSNRNANPNTNPGLLSDPKQSQEAVVPSAPEATNQNNKAAPNDDPSNASPALMSQIHNALRPDQSNGGTPAQNPSASQGGSQGGGVTPNKPAQPKEGLSEDPVQGNSGQQNNPPSSSASPGQPNNNKIEAPDQQNTSPSSPSSSEQQGHSSSRDPAQNRPGQQNGSPSSSGSGDPGQLEGSSPQAPAQNTHGQQNNDSPGQVTSSNQSGSQSNGALDQSEHSPSQQHSSPVENPPSGGSGLPNNGSPDGADSSSTIQPGHSPSQQSSSPVENSPSGGLGSPSNGSPDSPDSSPTQQSPSTGDNASPNGSGSPKSESPAPSGQSNPEQQNFSPAHGTTPGGSQSPNDNSKNPAIPTASTLSISGNDVVVGPSAVHIDGSEIKPQAGPVTVPGGVAINQGSSIIIGSQVYQIPTTTPAPVTMIAGHEITPVANGAEINGDTITAGADAATVSGTPISVDSSSQMHVGDSIYQLSAANPAPTTTLPNGAPAVVLPKAVSIHGTTLSAGAPPATISGTPVSLDSSNNLIYGATALALPSIGAPLPSNLGPVIGLTTTINDHPIVPLTQGISIAGTTLTPGAPPITVSDTPISLALGSLVIGTNSNAFTPQAAEPSITGQTSTLNAHPFVPLINGVSIAGTTLTPGAPAITISNTPISVGPSALVVGTSSVALALPDPDSLITTIAGQPLTANPSAVAFGSTTLTPGAPGVMISGTPVSLGEAGGLVIASSTIPLSSNPIATPLITTIAGQPLTANPTAIILPSTTLTPGAPAITISGTPISLNTAGDMIIASSTVPLTPSSSTFLVTTIAGQPLTANPSAVAFGSTTLTPGAPAITISGTPVSLNTAGDMIIGSSTIDLGSGNGTTGSGGVIATATTTPTGVAGAGSSSSGVAANAPTQEGGAKRISIGWSSIHLHVMTILAIAVIVTLQAI